MDDVETKERYSIHKKKTLKLGGNVAPPITTNLSTGDTRRPDIEGIGVRWYEDLRSMTSSKQKIKTILVQAPW